MCVTVQCSFNTGRLHPRLKTKPGGSLWKCTRTIRGTLTPSQVFNNWSLNITKCQLKHMSIFWIVPVEGLSDLKLQDFRHLSSFQGGLAETLPSDGSVGPLFACIIKKQVAVQIFIVHHSNFDNFCIYTNLISSSLSDLGTVTGSFSHIAPMKRTQLGEKIVLLHQCNDGNATHQIHCLCSLMDL